MRHATRHLVVSSVAGLTALAALGGCAEGPCDLPSGCLRVERVGGSCGCQEWQVVETTTVPVKFVVTAVEYGLVGNGSLRAYGWNDAVDAAVPTDSVLGSRLRVAARVAGEADRLAAMTNLDPDWSAYPPLMPVTDASADMLLAWGNGRGSGSAYTDSSGWDLVDPSWDRIVVWANPALVVTTDAAGGRRARWSWSPDGNCPMPPRVPCLGAWFLSITVGELDGTREPGDVYVADFLATLTAEERATILAYHPLYDPPGRDPGSVGADPRFRALGNVTVRPEWTASPSTAWLPCEGTLTDADPALREVELPVPAAPAAPAVAAAAAPAPAPARLYLQHAVLSRQPACRTERPGLSLATSTPGCQITSVLYVDRAFGTLLFLPYIVSPSCTRP